MDFFEHGGAEHTEIRYDFSVNINPLGLPQSADLKLKNIREEAIHYPDIRCRKLKDIIAEKWCGTPEQIVCTNGASEAIYGLVRAVRPIYGIILSPTFSEYERAFLAADIPFLIYPLQRKTGFSITEEFLAFLENREAGGLLFLCNPNNPIGNVIEKDLMLRIVKKAEERNLYVVIDECFLPFLPEYASVSFRSAYQNHKNACVINAFTKLYAMPGLRLGFVLSADRELLTKLKEQLPAWNVSAVAQEAGTAALLDPAYLEKTYQWITAERSYVGENLLLCKPRIKKVYCPAANFVFFEADDMLKDHLLQRQIAVRSCENFRGLKCGDYRAAIRSHAENKYLIEAIREEAHKWHEI